MRDQGEDTQERRRGLDVDICISVVAPKEQQRSIAEGNWNEQDRVTRRPLQVTRDATFQASGLEPSQAMDLAVTCLGESAWQIEWDPQATH